MNCSNCGAAMELVESRRYFRCRHCGSFHFPEAVEADGIRVVGDHPGAPACPVCTTPLAHALLDEHHPIDFCRRCRGVLLPRATFATVVNKRREWATGPPAEPVPLDRRELHRRLRCPRCGGAFETYPHLGPGAVVIDNCTRCDVIWLDFGEMKQMVDAPGGDRGTRGAGTVVRESTPETEDADARPGGDDPLTALLELLNR